MYFIQLKEPSQSLVIYIFQSGREMSRDHGIITSAHHLNALLLSLLSYVRKLASAVSCVLVIILDGMPNFTEAALGVPSVTLGLYQEPDLKMSSSCAGELVFLI